MIPKNRIPTHPGKILLDHFLVPMGKTQKELQLHLKWTYAKVNEIINGKRGVTSETALSLADLFGTTPQFWANLQMNYDLHIASKQHKKHKPFIKKIA